MWCRVWKLRKKWFNIWCFCAPNFRGGPRNVCGAFVNHHFRPTGQVWLRFHCWCFIYADEIKKNYSGWIALTLAVMMSLPVLSHFGSSLNKKATRSTVERLLYRWPSLTWRNKISTQDLVPNIIFLCWRGMLIFQVPINPPTNELLLYFMLKPVSIIFSTFTFAICYRSSVCLSSVTLVHPTQPVEIFGNFSSPIGTVAIHWHPWKILLISSQGNPRVGRGS